MRKNTSFLLLVLVLVFSCKPKQNVPDRKALNGGSTLSEISPDSSAGISLRNEYMVLATLYQQTAGEYRALCYQAYNIGRLMLDKDLADKTIDKHRVIVLDVDETVLDNSPFQAKCILEGTSYPVNWDEWCNLAMAGAVPGALDFLAYAKANGLSIYYVTNRKNHLKEVTIANLKQLGFPDADTDHVIMRTDENSKEPRRLGISERNHISLLFGDNLNDFSDIFEKNDNSLRNKAVDSVKKAFGQRFIVLPNAMYGDWESAIYQDRSKESDSVKFQLRRGALRSF
ncbi:MAG: 5'-nucleotidase, lipoprotein e(P4) family [Bacteroidales bacterium]|nr:5'-nucleotidase, lipoprotein e(P4) family [Bacteroidales bacterium]